MTGTSRLAIGGAISAANQRRRALVARVASAPPTGGRQREREPPASFTPIRTWRTSRSCEVRSARNFSAGTSCCIEPDRLADQQLGKLHRGGDLDPGGGARLQDRHRARDQPRDHVDQDENDQQLRPDRAAIPQRMRQGARRRPRQRPKQWRPAFGLGADERPPGRTCSASYALGRGREQWYFIRRQWYFSHAPGATVGRGRELPRAHADPEAGMGCRMRNTTPTQDN